MEPSTIIDASALDVLAPRDNDDENVAYMTEVKAKPFGKPSVLNKIIAKESFDITDLGATGKVLLPEVSNVSPMGSFDGDQDNH